MRGSIAVRGSVQDTLQSLTYAKLNYLQLIRTIWRKGNEEEEGNQRLLVNETAPTKLCSPSKRWRIVGQKREYIIPSSDLYMKQL